MSPTDYLSSSEANVLAYAARYAYDRPTTIATLDVVHQIVLKWPRLYAWQQAQFHREIRAEALDSSLWADVLALSVRASPSVSP